MRRILFISLFFLVFPAALLFSQNGTPLPDDVYWDNSFGHPLPEGYTGYPGVATKDGKFYVSSGPILYFHNGYQYYGIAEWDGKGWTYLGPTGSDRKAFEVLLPMGDSVLVGGDFQNLNGSGIDYLALWDGTQYNAVGEALNGRVRAMRQLSNGDVIVGGEFTMYGASQADRLARWDGSSWHILTNGVGSYGVNGTVYSIAGSDSGMYIGGSFGNAGGLTGVNRIVHYNPTNMSFTALGSGFDSDVYNVVNGGGILRAGGIFYNSGATPTKFFAEDSGSGWVDRNYGLTVQAPWNSMYSTPSGVWYIAGSYYLNTDSWGLLRYNGAGWDVVDSLFPGNFFFLTGDADTIYASVGTTKDVTRDFRGIGRWDGTRWSGLGNPIGLFYENPGANRVHAIGYANGTVYAAGFFYQAGDIRRNSGINLVMMTNQGWQEVGGHIMSGSNTGYVNQFGTMGTDLYAGGLFSDIGGTSMRNIGRWDGAAWHALGAGVNGEVAGIAVNGSDVFVVGDFDSAGTQLVHQVARWDGASWHSLGNGIGSSPSSYYPYAVVVSGTNVFVAGRFTYVDSNKVEDLSGLAKWDGSQWSALPAPPSPGQFSAISSLVTIGNNLYVNFNTYYNGDYKGFVYQWDGNTWTQIGGEFENTVNALWANGTELYATGVFTGVDADTVWRVAKWNGSKWVGLGTGLANGYNNVIQGNCLLGTPDGLYVGGSFSQAGMYSSYDIALWKDFTYQSPVTALSTPVLTSPADNAIDQPLSLTLSWNSVSGATIYQVQVSTDSTFGTTMVNDSSLASPSKGLSALSNDTKYFWRVRAANTSGASWWSPVWSFRTVGGATAVKEQAALPKEFALGQNYPNPFNPSTTIEFAVPKQAYVELEVYDVLSRRVATLVQGVLSPGYHKATFNGKGLPSGIYFYRLRAGTVVITKKLMMIK